MKHSTYNLPSIPRDVPVAYETKDILDLLEKYEVDAHRGFLFKEEPLQRLTHPKYKIWEDLAEDMPKLLGARGAQVKAPLEQLPVISIDDLTSSAELRRAQLLLGLFAHAYVWCTVTPALVLPKGVAVPLWEVSVRLDVPPVLTQLTIVLSNWRLLDPAAAVCMENLATLHNFFGGRDESWFYLITAEVEMAGAAAVVPLLLMQKTTQEYFLSEPRGKKEEQLMDVMHEATRWLGITAAAIKTMVTSFKKMREGCHPMIFYHRVRPFLAGWRANPALPGGLRYEGVAVRWEDRNAFASSEHIILDHEESFFDATTPSSTPAASLNRFPTQEFYGGSAAQSSLLPFLDICLGVDHSAHNASAAGGNYLVAMRQYMYRPHREFLQHLETNEFTARRLVMHIEGMTSLSAAEKSAFATLKSVYNECLEHLQAFRTSHISVVAEYIMSQQKNGVAINSIEGSAGGKGTGGTDLMQFLKPLRDDVKNT